MMTDVGIIAYESRSYGPSGQTRDTFTRHIYTGGAVEGSLTLCGRTITNSNTRHKWTAMRAGLEGRNPSEVDCMQCLDEKKLRRLGYQIRRLSAVSVVAGSGNGYTEVRTRVFMSLLPSQTTQEARQTAFEQEQPPDTRTALDPTPASNQPLQTTPEPYSGWTPPAPERVREALDHLMSGQGYETNLAESLSQMRRANDLDRGRLGRFLKVEDWQVIAYAVSAWVIANEIKPECVQDYGNSEEALSALIVRASRSAASIW